MEVHLVRADLVVVGSLSSDLAPVAADYERRLTRYVKLHVHELKAEPTARGDQVVLRAEGERMVDAVARIQRQAGGERTTVVALDAGGKTPTTEQLAEGWLAQRHLVLLVGGTMGLAPEARALATGGAVSFGRITLPHQLARVVATEQLYRSFRIARGEPYHF